MKIKITSCNNCPFKRYIYEQGFCGNICGISKDAYNIIPKHGIKENCPLKTEKIKIVFDN